METLKMEHIAPYLPFKLQAILTADHNDDFACEDYWTEGIFDKGSKWEFAGICDPDLNIPMGEGEINTFILRYGSTYTSLYNGFKPLLRPLTDLKNTIQIAGESFRPIIRLLQASCFDTDKLDEDEIIGYIEPCFSPEMITYKDAKMLLEWHFDLFGLIEKGLAIDINKTG